MKALLHVHSDYSYDGEPSLEQLAAWGESRGLGAILLTEHINDFDQAKMERYVDAVDRLATRSCRLVAGLEFAARGGFHILGFNIRRWRHLVDAAEVARFIGDQGGLAVLAHPARYRGKWPDAETLRRLHGIEVWNARYDGRFLPPGDLLDATRSLCAEAPNLRLHGGQDLHRMTPKRLVVTEAAGAANVDEFMVALAEGRARFGAPGFWISGRPNGAAPALPLIKLGHRSYRLARRLRNRWLG